MQRALEQRAEALSVADKLHTQRFQALNSSLETSQLQASRAVASESQLRQRFDQLQRQFDHLYGACGRVVYVAAPMCAQLRECVGLLGDVAFEWASMQDAIKVTYMCGSVFWFVVVNVCVWDDAGFEWDAV
jgi:hypothetical protein